MNEKETRNQFVQAFDLQDADMWERAQAFALKQDDFLEAQGSDGLQFREAIEKLMILSISLSTPGEDLRALLLSAFTTGRYVQHLISTREWVFEGSGSAPTPADLDKLWGGGESI
jgi:hypothetical protein